METAQIVFVRMLLSTLYRVVVQIHPTLAITDLLYIGYWLYTYQILVRAAGSPPPNCPWAICSKCLIQMNLAM